MEKYTRVTGKKMYNLEMGFFILQMEINLKENILKEKKWDQEPCILETDPNLQENGCKISQKVVVFYITIMVTFLKEIFKMEKNKVMANL